MPPLYTKEELRKFRNNIDIEGLIANIVRLPHKISEGRFRFLCPLCGEFNTAVNHETNLARCFRCEKNFNPIDMVMEANGATFLEALEFLSPFI